MSLNQAYEKWQALQHQAKGAEPIAAGAGGNA